MGWEYGNVNNFSVCISNGMRPKSLQGRIVSKLSQKVGDSGDQDSVVDKAEVVVGDFNRVTLVGVEFIVEGKQLAIKR